MAYETTAPRPFGKREGDCYVAVCLQPATRTVKFEDNYRGRYCEKHAAMLGKAPEKGTP